MYILVKSAFIIIELYSLCYVCTNQGNREMFVAICFVSQSMKRSKHGLFVFPPKKTLIWRLLWRHTATRLANRTMPSIDWFLESSRAWSFFTRAFASLCTFDKPIKSLYFRSFDVCFVRAFSFQGHTKIALLGTNELKCEYESTWVRNDRFR